MTEKITINFLDILESEDGSGKWGVFGTKEDARRELIDWIYCELDLDDIIDKKKIHIVVEYHCIYLAYYIMFVAKDLIKNKFKFSFKKVS